MTHLTCSVDVPQPLLEQTYKAIQARPDLINHLTDRVHLTAELPAKWKRQMMAQATHGRLTISHGRIWKYSETWGASSGGYIGSCMPPSLVSAFLRLWLSQVQSQVAQDVGEQMEMFA